MPNKRAQMPDEDLVRLYLSEIGHHRLLTKEEEATLAQAAEAGREARVELAVDLDVSTDRIVEILRHAATPASLSEPLRHDSDAELGDLIENLEATSPFESAATALLPGQVARMLARLDAREREIIRLRFGLDRGEPRTLEEVSVSFGLTRERIPPDRSPGHVEVAPPPQDKICGNC